MKIRYCYFLLILMICITHSCKKFLDEKPDKKLVTASTLADLWALMDHSNVMIVNDPYIDELSADNFFLPLANFNSMAETDRNVYLWKNENLHDVGVNNWSRLYNKIYYANTVLEVLETIDRHEMNRDEWDHLKGHALTVRAKAFLHVLFIWAKAYDAGTASTDMGIPLRLNTNFDEVSTRASVATCYELIIANLKEAAALLSNRSLAVNRVTKQVAYGLLARAYLSMREYPEMGLYADSSLQLYSNLLDYNNLNANASFPIPRLNTEIMFYSSFHVSALGVSSARIDTTLYASYLANDLRKKIFFRLNTDGTYGFKGTYLAATGQFGGVATDEIYLMRAEAYARENNKDSALAVLNRLLKFRYDRNSFVPVQAADADAALLRILTERRKELIFRGLRWMDIKRLNKEGAGIIQRRKMNGVEYVLAPNANRYAMPIPEYVINLTGMVQNP